MKREIGLQDITRDDSSIVTVGTFDGIHIGHQSILRYLYERARERSGTSVVVTFDPHPREVVHYEAVPLLTTIPERADLIEALGIDRFVVIPFTQEFAQLTAEQFIERVLLEKIGLKEIVVGYDHAFGRGREGDIELLERLGIQNGFGVDVVPAAQVKDRVVSSSKLRHLIQAEGYITLANQMLGRYYSTTGVVVEGSARGRILGFPTANIKIDFSKKLIPKEGVYAVRVKVGERVHPYQGMLNIGRRPTFGEDQVRIEVHLLDFEEDLYGKELKVEFVQRLRDERKFKSTEELKTQLYQDKMRCKEVLDTIT